MANTNPFGRCREWPGSRAQRSAPRGRTTCDFPWSARRTCSKTRWSASSGFPPAGGRRSRGNENNFSDGSDFAFGLSFALERYGMMKTAVRLSIGILLAAGLTACAFAQAKPFPSADVQKTYERLLNENDKITMYDNHAHHGYADDSDV